MRRIISVIIFISIHLGLCAQDDPMSYFIGKWDFKVWFAGNTNTKPDLKALWTLEKSVGNNFDAHGKVVVEDKGETTKEQMGFDKAKGLYFRTVTASEGLFFFTSSGWKGNKLTWEGYLVPMSDERVPMKEEITKISANEFHAVFYKKQGDSWEVVTREELKRN
ncbi:MAG: hypothetical protein ACJ77K_01245 [Bacteroidia bacterium]|jgi:hypothetical protein